MYKQFNMYEVPSGWLVEYLTNEIYPTMEEAQARVDRLVEQKPVYLIKYWEPYRNTTEDSPKYYIGTDNSYFDTAEDASREKCYRSWKQAVRSASRWQNLAWKSYPYVGRYKVVEVFI